MTRRDIDQDKICRFVLHKQHLAEPSRATGKKLVGVVKDVCGLHAQVASTPYLSLFNRIKDFQKDDLTRALYDQRSLVKIWGVRATVHIVATDQVAEYYQATRYAGGRHPLRIEPGHRQILKLLDAKGPLTAQEIADALPELAKRVQTPQGEMSAGAIRLRELTQSTILVPVTPRGDWTSSLHTYTGFSTWLPKVDLAAVSEADARTRVISRYLAGFGPATVDDIAWWMGISKAAVAEALHGMRRKVAEIEVAGLDGRFIVLKSDLEALVRFSPGPDACQLLPKFDPYIMGYKNRQRLIPARHENKVYRSSRAEVLPCIVANGRIIGTWDYKQTNRRLVINLSVFEKITTSLARAITPQAERLSRFLDADEPEIRFSK